MKPADRRPAYRLMVEFPYAVPPPQRYSPVTIPSERRKRGYQGPRGNPMPG